MSELSRYLNNSIDFLKRYQSKYSQLKAIEMGFTVPQIKVIGEVVVRKKISIKNIAIHLKMSQSTVSDIVDRLISKEVLMKKPNEHDKRISDISMTDASMSTLFQDVTIFDNNAIDEVLEYVTDDNKKLIEHGFQLFVHAVIEKMKNEGYEDKEFIRPEDFIY